MINLENLTGWLSETANNWSSTVATSVSGFTGWAQDKASASVDWISNTLPATIDGAIDTATTAVSNAAGAIAGGISDAASGAIDIAWDWAGDLVPDWLLPAAGLGGGGLLALLGFRMARSVMGQRQRAAAEFALFKVPAAQYEKIEAILQAGGITVNEGEVIEGWAIFSVPRYHLGPAKRILNDLKVEWDTVG